MNLFEKENIIIFTFFVALFSVIVLFYSEETNEDVYTLIYITPITIIVIMSLSLSRRYRKIAHFCYGHMILGFAYISMLVAEIVWRLMDYLNMSQYESYPDIFYAGYGILLIMHPWIIMRHFKVKPSRLAWMLFVLCIVGGNGIYYVISMGHEDTSSFVFGLAFVTMTNTLLGSVVVAMITLRGTRIFRVWILLGIAFFINAISDIYYYASENFSDWTQGDLVNIVWFASYIIIIYALTEHRYMYSSKTH